MASKLVLAKSNTSQVSQFAAKNACGFYKQLLEKNKDFNRQPATVEECCLLSKQLFYTRLASIPGRYESFWKECDSMKHLWKNRHELIIEDASVATLFGLECYMWLWAGKIVGSGFTFTSDYQRKGG